jgi:kynurenine formamidase
MNFIEIKDKDGKIVEAIAPASIVFVERKDFIIQDIWSGKDKTIYRSKIYFSNGTSTSVDVPIEDIISQMNK